MGAALYTFTVAGKTLAYKECLLSEAPPRIYSWKQGQRAMSNQEYSKHLEALGKTVISKRKICGGDKPVETLKLTTPEGDTEYADSFDSCQAKSTYIDNIDAVFDVLRNLPKQQRKTS
jgi:SOS-response transcriptional repressor LexA